MKNPFNHAGKPKVLVAVLCGPERYQWPAPGLMMRVIEATHVPDVVVQVATVYGVYGYAAARNRAVEMFLASDADWLCMIDNDNVPPANFIPRVLAFASSRPDVDLVPLPAYIRANASGQVTALCTGWHGSRPNEYALPFQLPSGWQEIHVAGMACTFITRRVLTTLSRPWFRISDYCRQTNMVNGAGEDFLFCDQARAAGFRVWTNGDLLCDHLHTMSLSAVARATVEREESDLEALRSVGINIPQMVRVCCPPPDCEQVG